MVTTRSPPSRIGCAGWSLPRAAWPAFPATGSHLERYAARLNTAEIDSSFHRLHQPQAYARWAAAVPKGLRFSVKLPKTITHEKRLVDCGALPDLFLAQASGLGDKTGCLLVEIPSSLALDGAMTNAFLRSLRQKHTGPVALEARLPDGSRQRQMRCLLRGRRRACWPTRCALMPGAGRTATRRWSICGCNGSPRMYYSACCAAPWPRNRPRNKA